jgi:hypothetical protein
MGITVQSNLRTSKRSKGKSNHLKRVHGDFDFAANSKSSKLLWKIQAEYIYSRNNDESGLGIYSNRVVLPQKKQWYKI